MGQSKQFSKWSAFVLSFAFFGFGGMTCETISAQTAGGDDGWFNPAVKTLPVTESDDISTMELTFDDEPNNSEAIRPVAYPTQPKAGRGRTARKTRRIAMNSDEDLSWSIDGEEGEYSFAETAKKKTAEIPEEVEFLPDDAVQGSIPEPEMIETDTPEAAKLPNNHSENNDLLPTFEPESFQKENRTVKDGSSVLSEENGNGQLPQANTQIDRFGNIGYFGNDCAARTEDGGQTCNPYSTGIFDFHPRYFPWDPMHQTHTRIYPPVESYGTDCYGNSSMVSCCDGSCCEYCYEGCDGSCCENCGGCYHGCCRYGCCGLFSGIWYALRTGEFSAGAYTYQAPGAQTSNFGADLGFNWTFPRRIMGLTWQTGGRYLRSGQNKSEFGAEDYHRSQTFFTAGLFYHIEGDPWKFGVVYDCLNDKREWDYSLGQIRTELSYGLTPLTDIGFRGAFQVDDEVLKFSLNGEDYESKVSAQSYYTGFLRHTFVTGAEGMIGAGATDNSGALLNCRIEAPISNCSSIRSSFAYIFPKGKEEKRNSGDTWSASITWVIYLGGSSHGGIASAFKPLFDVADNTTFLQKGE